MALPTGTVTFLLTDVEGSTVLWAEHTTAMDRAVARHDALLRQAVDDHAGYVFATGGDSFAVAFSSPADAVAAAVHGQSLLAAEAWDGLPAPLRVRMGLHRGDSHERGGDYFGPTVNLAARVMAAAWGGQILCTELVVAHAPGTTTSLGEHRLRDIPGPIALHQVEVPASRDEFPAPRTIDVAPSTLPTQRSTFVGRRRDIEAVRRLLLDHRLVTLTGAGGIGKTRLAIEVAGREAPHRWGGTFFADLAPVDRAEHVAATVARACLAPPDPGRSSEEQLFGALADQAALVVLDNCEHLVGTVADLADRVLRACPRVVVLATSREGLDLPGEHRVRVDPIEPAGADARALFVERATELGGPVDPVDEDVAALCGRLDGIPLAIELAAARTRTLTPTQILDRLGRNLDVLAGNRRGTPDRHQTLRATIDWSYALCEPAEQDLLDRLSVFVATFDLAAAASLIDGDVDLAADLLDGLVAKSMVATVDDLDGGRRFRLLDTVRTYADECLRRPPERRTGARRAIARHHVARLAAVPTSRTMARDLRTQLEPDLDDIRWAVTEARASGPVAGALGARASFPLVMLLVNLGLVDEARDHVAAALDTEGLEPSIRGRLLAAHAYLEGTADGSSDFATIARSALAHLEPGDGVWSAALGLTSIPLQMFAPADVLPAFEEGRRRVLATGSAASHDRAMLDFYTGGTLMNLRRFDEATEVFLRGAATITAIEPTSLVRLWSVSGAAIGQTLSGRPHEALDGLAEVAPLADWTDWAAEWAFARAFALAHDGRPGEAHDALRPIGSRMSRGRPSPLAATVVCGFAVLAAMEGRPDRARTLVALTTATRSPASTAATYEIIGRLDGWSDDEFANQKVTRALLAAGRQNDLNREELFAQLSALVQEEAGPVAAGPVERGIDRRRNDRRASP